MRGIHSQPPLRGGFRERRRVAGATRWLLPALLALAVLSSLQGGPANPEGETARQRIEDLIRQNNLGIAHLARFREPDAIEAFRKALAVDPDYAIARINLGIAHLSLADYPAAERELRRGVELAPGNPCGLFNLGLVFKIQGRTPEAIQAFEAVAKADPDDPDTLYQLATLYARERRLDEAVNLFRRSLALGPQNVSAYYGLGKALLQTGDVEEGKRYLETSQRMKEESGLNTTVGTRYGEQGKYSWAAEDDRIRMLARAPAPPPIPVRFSAVPAADWGGTAKGLAACPDGAGAAASDVDADGDLDLFLPTCVAGPPGVLLRNEGSLRFRDATAEAGLGQGGGGGMAAAFGDYDNDRRPDLVVTAASGVRLFRNVGDGRFQETGEAAGVRAAGRCAAAAWVDVDHDGDLDLYVVRRGVGDVPSPGNLLFRNRGDGTFGEDAAAARLGGAGAAGPSLVWSDLDNDRDIDLLLPGENGAWQLLSNDRVGTFSDVAASRGIVGPAAHAAAVGDFDKDGFMDIAAAGPAGLTLLRNGAGATFVTDEGMAPLAAAHAGPGYGVAFLDFDNDGYLDLAMARGSGEGPGMLLLRNAGEGRFEDWTERAQVPPAGGGARALLPADLDGDGDLDLLLTRAAAPPLLLRNEGGSRRASLQVDPVGKGSNRSGVGTKVEVKAGGLWQKLEVASASGYLTGVPERIHLGLGEATRADTLRFLWPSGVLQDEIDVAAGPRVEIEELDRKGSSCPILYAWNGSAFGFVTDFLGGSAVGYRVGAAAFNTPDTDEYVKIRGEQLQPRDGRLLLRLVNQLEEVIFFDRARLLAVDHPETISVYPNERLLPAPPFPEFELFAVAEERPPAAAEDDQGRDLLPQVLEEDRRWPDGFQLLPYKGYAEEHALILDPGDLRGAERVVLLADAWIDYADSTSNLAASQAGLALQAPRLEVVGPGGGWVTALPQMGFPAGLPKTLTVELTGLFRREDDFRIRVVTNMRIYWDRIRFGIVAPDEPARVTAMEPAEAELRFHGYPRPVSPDNRAPFGYDYHDPAPQAGWKDFRGHVTRYGDVVPLLATVDDRYAILRHGDEVALAFPVADLPRLPPGWTRDYLLYADGFGKDMDINSAAPDRVEPLPFHGMAAYPPDPAEAAAHGAGRLEWILEVHRRAAAPTNTARP